ncbi:MAG: DUF1512 family protein [archaeon]
MSPFLMGGESSTIQTMINWAIMLAIFMFVLPKLYFYQIFSKLDLSAKKLEALSEKGQKILLDRTEKFTPSKKTAKGILNNFIDFFMIPPVSLDPFGIVKKLEHMIDQGEKRFKDVAKQMAPKANLEQQMNVDMGLQAATMLHTLAKIVRHFVETAKKFKNLQIAMIIQMQLPIIEKMAEAEFDGMETFLKGMPIGDAAGPLTIASLVDKEGKEIAPDVIAVTEKRWGRNITFMKAKGPGGRLGKLGKAVENACKGKKIAKIITIDAAQKLEGEKTGSVAEGIGVAMGGPGVQKSQIEDVAVRLGIPVDAIAIKMSSFQAIKPMPIKVLNAIDKAKDILRQKVEDAPKGSNIVVIGVGNTCGIPNTNKSLNTIKEAIKREARRKKEEEEKKQKRGFFNKPKKSDYEDDEDTPSTPLTSLGMFMSFMHSRIFRG